MKHDFYNRDDEMRRLRRFLTTGNAGLVVVYGRRRCGKSTLLQRVLSRRSNGRLETLNSWWCRGRVRPDYLEI